MFRVDQRYSMANILGNKESMVTGNQIMLEHEVLSTSKQMSFKELVKKVFNYKKMLQSLLFLYIYHGKR